MTLDHSIVTYSLSFKRPLLLSVDVSLCLSVCRQLWC